MTDASAPVHRGAQLARRRAGLVARSRQLRGDLAADGAAIASRLSIVDRGVALARAVGRRPLVLAAGAALLFTGKPIKVLKWVTRGALLLSVARRAYGAMNRGDPGEPPTFI